MGKRAEEAVKKHHSGYNCAQAVACTFSDVIGMDEKDVFRMSEGFGFGMGANETCGAVCRTPSGRKTLPSSAESCWAAKDGRNSEAVPAVWRMPQLCWKKKFSPNKDICKSAGLQDTKNNRPPPDRKI